LILTSLPEIESREEKIAKTRATVTEMPVLNFILLKSLQSHLLRIVKESSINKMSVRNLSIVFSPTLGIPAAVFALMISEFDTVFSRVVNPEEFGFAEAEVEDDASQL
jgi:RalA-binding protein 1